MKTDNSKIWLASLKSGGQVTCSQRDLLLIQQYAESIGMQVEVVKKDGMTLTVKAKENG